MAKRYFSSQQLYALRNDIDVRMLIEKTLRIPCRVTEGCFRFLCPICNEFNTSVKYETNLARCFRCEKNFNTIDLVMMTRQADFVQSAKFLQSIHQKDSVCRDRGKLGTISGKTSQADPRMKHKAPSAKSDRSLCHIGEILGSVLAPNNGTISKKRAVEHKPDNAMTAPEKIDEDRIIKLEQQLKHLDRQIQKLTRTINAALPSK
jgi:DNA primase